MNEAGLLKKEVFNRLLDMVGRVFVVLRHSGTSSIGRRGFTEDEKQNGLTLVFNSSMHIFWDDDGISATLSFGSVAEKCLISASDIVAIYSPEAGVQMVFDPAKEKDSSGDSAIDEGVDDAIDDVASVFSKHKSKPAFKHKAKSESEDKLGDKPEDKNKDKPEPEDKPEDKNKDKVIRVDFNKRGEPGGED